jgi:hypothetical protein
MSAGVPAPVPRDREQPPLPLPAASERAIGIRPDARVSSGASVGRVISATFAQRAKGKVRRWWTA